MTEIKSLNINNKKITRRFLAIHTSTGTVNLVTKILAAMASEGGIPFIPLKRTKQLRRDNIQRALQRNKKTVDSVTCIAVFGINEEVLDKARTFRGG